MKKIEIKIRYHEEILDPQGLSVAETLRSIGFDSVRTVRIGKLITLELDCDDKKEIMISEIKKQVISMCDKLLTNSIMENYEIELK
jgi:phosphoribosylformylglycinamidine synthase